MASVLSRGQQLLGGAATLLALAVVVGLVCLIGGTAGGWFGGEEEAATKHLDRNKQSKVKTYFISYNKTSLVPRAIGQYRAKYAQRITVG